MEKENKTTEEIKRPSFLMNISEGYRALKDFKKSSDFIKSYYAETPGDGHPVLVIPGLLGNKSTTYRLRKFIKKMGYKPYDWRQGVNMGDIEDVEPLQQLLADIYQKHQTKVTVIGWSLGGIYARELAKMNPEQVRQVITLGSPFANISAPNNASWLLEWLHGDIHTDPRYSAWLSNLSDPAPVPTTAVYSKEDGVVPWKVCREPKEDSMHQNVEVTGSHLGLTNNASVWFLIADRLPYSMANWEPFVVPFNTPAEVIFPNLERQVKFFK